MGGQTRMAEFPENSHLEVLLLFLLLLVAGPHSGGIDRRAAFTRLSVSLQQRALATEAASQSPCHSAKFMFVVAGVQMEILAVWYGRMGHGVAEPSGAWASWELPA